MPKIVRSLLLYHHHGGGGDDDDDHHHHHDRHYRRLLFGMSGVVLASSVFISEIEMSVFCHMR